MVSGRETLGSLDESLRQLHDSVQEIDQQVKESSRALMDLQREQAGRFQRMAQIRLDRLISGELTEGLNIADQRAGELIRQRGSKLGVINRQVRAVREQLDQLEGRREEARQACDRATETLDKAEAVVQERLQGDPDYQAQLNAAQEAERMARHALDKTRQAEKTRREKGETYEKDPLFSYLWQRGYGTSTYSAGALTRYLDDWVARLCDYRAVRPNYAMLLEIPVRLAEHGRGLQQAADEEFIQLTRMEVAAAEADGIPALKQSVDEAQAGLDAIDGEIELTENRLHELEGRRNRFANGEDEDFQQAVKTISDAFERENLLTLYEYARATATPEDDILVQEMDEAGEQLRQVKGMLADRKQMRERQSDRLQELEGIRRRFKRNRFDSPHSEFRNDALVAMALSQFLTGTVTGGELWRTIERLQRYRRIRANPNFGSGGFLPRSGTWHTPFPRGGGLGGGWGGSGRFPRSGGGGFRTGGGF